MTLQSSQLIGFGAGVGTVTVAFTAAAVDTVNATAFTFSGHSLGAAEANRKIVITVFGVGTTASSRLVSTLTIGGVSATLAIAVQNSTEDHYACEIWYATVPTGTTGDVVVTWNAAMGNCAIGAFRVIGAAITDHANASDNDSDPLTANINVPAGGILIGGGGEDAVATFTWTNITEAYDEAVEGNQRHTGASKEFTALQDALAITLDPSATDRLASWGPA